MPDGCPLTSDINNNNRSGSGHGNCSRCASNACGNTKCNSGACYGQTPGAAHQNGGGSAYAGAASQGGKSTTQWTTRQDESLGEVGSCVPRCSVCEICTLYLRSAIACCVIL
ncbi:uncharacterized protein [Bemisia tabaci]|uniref:uncharacterized protein n=1 Tax=Bemisia tabaci TaxID=7038 RepID=UPI003B28C52A